MRNYSMFLREAPHSSALSLDRQKGCSLDVFQMIAWSMHAVWKFLSVGSESGFSGGGGVSYFLVEFLHSKCDASVGQDQKFLREDLK